MILFDSDLPDMDSLEMYNSLSSIDSNPIPQLRPLVFMTVNGTPGFYILLQSHFNGPVDTRHTKHFCIPGVCTSYFNVEKTRKTSLNSDSHSSYTSSVQHPVSDDSNVPDSTLVNSFSYALSTSDIQSFSTLGEQEDSTSEQKDDLLQSKLTYTSPSDYLELIHISETWLDVIQTSYNNYPALGLLMKLVFSPLNWFYKMVSGPLY